MNSLKISAKISIYRTSEDEVGNVIIRKPATSGMENRQPYCFTISPRYGLSKNNNVDFDFETQGIEMYADGDWVKAKGTTLGADNGLGCCSNYEHFRKFRHCSSCY